MADDKTPPATGMGDDFAEGMKKIAAAQQVDDDQVEIAADDQGASALAQKMEKSNNPNKDGSPQR